MARIAPRSFTVPFHGIADRAARESGMQGRTMSIPAGEAPPPEAVDPCQLGGAGRRMLNALIAATVLLVGLMLAGAGWRLYHEVQTENGLTPSAYEEWTAAKADHALIVAVAGGCRVESASFTHPLTLPAALLTLVPDRWRGQPAPSDMPPEPSASAPAPQVDTPSYMLGAVVLSNDIGRARVALAGKVSADNAWMQVFEWAMVLIGAITTVLISIKSIMTSRSPAFTVIGIGAIIFSTFGTSIAGINSFYGPRSIYEQDQRTLTNLRDLQSQIASGITRERGLCRSWTNPTRDWRFVQLRKLAEQYEAITSTEQVSGLSSEDDRMDMLPGGAEEGSLALPGGAEVSSGVGPGPAQPGAKPARP